MLASSCLLPKCSHSSNIYIFKIRIDYLFLNKIYIYFLSCIIENFALSLPGAGAGSSGSGAVIENPAPAPAPGGPKNAGSGSTSLHFIFKKIILSYKNKYKNKNYFKKKFSKKNLLLYL